MRAKIIIPLILLLSLTCILFANADTNTIYIATMEDFLSFSENCRLDNFSQDLTVNLTADIDLTNTEFDGIPIFCGTFNGNGHTISGYCIDTKGSTLGLFRYITEDATVSNLKLSGQVQPTGTKSNVGGIAGSNAGTILNCEFIGTVSGTEKIGGIAGINLPSGMIKDSSVSGTVYGSHFVGGLTGNNSGIIDGCTNEANINTELKQNEVNYSDITIDSLTGTESAVNITDVGGIVGITSGSVHSCTNHGNVGYPQIGYNIGGIAGTQSGYLTNCVNHGMICGRKDVGGITGQLEPALAVIYSTDTLQILQEQLNTLSALTQQTAKNLENSTSNIKNHITVILGELENAKDILDALLPTQNEEPNVTLPDLPARDAIHDAISELQSSIARIIASLKSIYETAEITEQTVSKDLEAISNCVEQIQATLNTGEEHLGSTLSDISDADNDEITTAKITQCQNMGAVNTDRNGGGIVGSIAIENDLDPEEDIEFFGDATLNITGAYRASVTFCHNTGQVTVKKQHGGGIVGYATLGLVHSSTNHADLLCSNASYIGGIAGRSNGYIRNCSSKTQITAKKYAGGIAGLGATVSDCRCITDIHADEFRGAILGFAGSLSDITENYYLLLGEDIGAIDGISYDSTAAPLNSEEFFLLENLPEHFRNASITFIFPDGTQTVLSGSTGDKIEPDDIPVLEEIDGCEGVWQSIPEILYFDTVVTAQYDKRTTTLQGQLLREDGRPIVLIEGSFLPNYQVSLQAIDISMPENAVEGFLIDTTDITTIHYLPPLQWEAEDLIVMMCSNDENWKQTDFQVNGSYLVFSLKDGCTRFCVLPAEKLPVGLYFAIGGFIALTVSAAVIIIVIHNRKKKTSTPGTHEATEQENSIL